MFGGIIKCMLGKKRFQGLFKKMHKICLSGMNIGLGADPKNSGEIIVLEYIKRKSTNKNKLVIFDVGANIGDYSRLLEEFFSDRADIYCFEPSRETYRKLSENFNGKKNIHIYNLGFSNEDKTVFLFADKNASGLASLYKRRLDHFNIHMNETEQVKVMTVDNFCRGEGIKKIDFLKLDIEGHELQALEGAREILKSNSIDFIQFEFGGCNIDSRTFFQDFYYLLKDDFYIYRIIQDGLYPIEKYEEACECFITTNFFAERRNKL